MAKYITRQKNKRSPENLRYNLNLIKENKETIFLCLKNNKIIGAVVMNILIEWHIIIQVI